MLPMQGRGFSNPGQGTQVPHALQQKKKRMHSFLDPGELKERERMRWSLTDYL